MLCGSHPMYSLYRHLKGELQILKLPFRLVFLVIFHPEASLRWGRGSLETLPVINNGRSQSDP